MDPRAKKKNARWTEPDYYSAYELNKVSGKDNKSARVSGVLMTPERRYYLLDYLGRRNMRWNTETEQLFRDQFEHSEIGGVFCSGCILLGEDWEPAVRLVTYGLDPYSRLIRLDTGNPFYYTPFDDNRRRLLRVILDEHRLYYL